VEKQEQTRLRRSTTLWGWLLRIAAVGVAIQLLLQVLRR
jgi:hypothetical protein